MNRNDWQRTEELFHAAVGLSAEERARYLAEACPDDAALRTEVESLIAAFENKHEFMERPAFSLGMRMLSEGSEVESLVGRQVGPYKIQAILGRGGMGEVYLAEDDLLNRKVALKFLSNKFTDDAWAKRLLMKEAQAIARLDHPNICAVHGFEEHGGYNFIVMQYIEGETLASLIHKGAFKAEQIPSLAIQIVSALEEAHSHGIVHRDIKPQNIMVAANGQLKVLDFGLAKLVQQKKDAVGMADSESQSSQLGLVLGTVAYMSPEQLRAERLDYRSDIFSFGIVLYEMISGRNPYSRASNAEIISAILTSDPEPSASPPTDIHAGLAAIAQKCLSKDRRQRYQSASELLLEIDNPPKEPAPGSYLRAYLSARKYVAAALLLLLIVAISVVVSYVFFRTPEVQTLAVLPVVNNSGDANTDFLIEGLTEGLTRRLSRLSAIRTKSPTFIPSYESEEEAAQKAGRDFNVDAVLFGRLISQGESLALQVTLVDARDASQWQEVYPVKQGELLRLQDELTRGLASRLRPSLSEDERRRLSAHPTEIEDAYRLYFYGRHFWNKRDPENIKKAIVHFEQAIELDPAYAKAYAGLADCYSLLSTVAFGPPLTTSEAMIKTRWAVKKALELDDTLAEAHTSLGVYILRYEWDWIAAEREFKQAINLNQDYAPAHFWFSNLLALKGNLGESLKESEKARDLEPFSPVAGMNHARAFYFSRQFDQAIDYCLKNLESNPNHLSTMNVLGFSYQQKGMLKESIEVFQKMYAANEFYGVAPLGFAYAKAGRRNEALNLIIRIEELSKQSYIPPQERAIIYIGLDDKDKAFMLLQEACKDRFASFPFLLTEPILDTIRSDPRFPGLTSCARLVQ
jgi:serine/threonine-protein kinase